MADRAVVGAGIIKPAGSEPDLLSVDTEIALVVVNGTPSISFRAGPVDEDQTGSRFFSATAHWFDPYGTGQSDAIYWGTQEQAMARISAMAQIVMLAPQACPNIDREIRSAIEHEMRHLARTPDQPKPHRMIKAPARLA